MWPLAKMLSICTLVLVFGFAPKLGAEKYRFVTFQYPPFEYANPDDAAEGIAVEIVTNVMHALGHEVEITVFPWTRSLNMVRIGTADAIFTAYKNAEREQFLDYSRQVLIPQVVYFYKRRDSNIQFTGALDGIKHLRIGVVSTISYGRRFDDAKGDLLIDKARILEHSFEKLLLGRVDLVPSSHYVADYTLSKLRLGDKIVRLPQKIESVPSFIAFSKIRGLSKLRDEFDRQISIMKQDGSYADIVNAYNAYISESKSAR